MKKGGKLNPLEKFYTVLLSLNPLEFTALSIVLGYLFSEGLNSNQVQSLGNFFESVGQTLLTIGMQMQNLEGNYENGNSTYEDSLEILKKKISNIDEILSNLKNLNL